MSRWVWACDCGIVEDSHLNAADVVRCKWCNAPRPGHCPDAPTIPIDPPPERISQKVRDKAREAIGHWQSTSRSANKVEIVLSDNDDANAVYEWLTELARINEPIEWTTPTNEHAGKGLRCRVRDASVDEWKDGKTFLCVAPDGSFVAYTGDKEIGSVFPWNHCQIRTRAGVAVEDE